MSKTRAETLSRIISEWNDCDGCDVAAAAEAVDAWIDAGMPLDPDPGPPEIVIVRTSIPDVVWRKLMYPAPDTPSRFVGIPIARWRKIITD